MTIAAVLFATNVVWYGVVFSNSEMTYLVFDHNPIYYDVITEAGMLVEDVPQFLIQLIYSLHMYTRFGHSVSSVQIASFAFTFWRFMFTVTHKYMMRNKGRPPAKSVVLNLVEAGLDAVR